MVRYFEIDSHQSEYGSEDPLCLAEWHWIVTGSTLRIIDFEHARADWSFVDLERVASSIPLDRSDLWSAFLSGYGLTLDGTEQALLKRLQFHATLSRVVWAVEHKDAELENSGMVVVHGVKSGFPGC